MRSLVLPVVVLVRRPARAVPPLLTNEEAAAYQAKRSVAPTSVRGGTATVAPGA